MADKIAVIGYACRLPGHVSTPDKLWELCTRVRSGWCEIPKDRMSFDAFHHPNPSKPGAFNSQGGYFLKEDISKFDASFFNLTAKEAISMDPQQRLLLECTFEALESAGIPKEKFAGQPVGVYIGGNVADYEVMNMRDIETVPMHQATGCAAAMSSNRISYCFDLRGPSMTFDTACSSSLVALHHAVRSLASGESTEAVVGGCRLNILPDYFVTMSMSQLFNDTGKTFAFDDRAVSGFARGEGAGIVILKPLEAAIRDRDTVRAVICTSGMNQDGKTQGITNPNGDAQRDLVKKLYTEAGLNPLDVGYAEMHGTGTKVGDPIEARAIHESLAQGRTPKDPLIIGSVKSNVGHLEGASGVISIIKASMMLEKELVLPNTNFKNPNPAIPLKDWNMKVLTSTRPWPRGKKYVSVSNYGFGGANAHAVLEMPPRHTRSAPQPTDADLTDPTKKLFVISANDKESLQERIKGLGIYFEQRPEVFEKLLGSNVAYTLGSRRSNLPYRLAVPAASLDELGSKLAQLRLNATRVLGSGGIRTAFVFTGQGAQWAQMGTGLIGQYPVFTSALTRADEYLRTLGADFSLISELQAKPDVSRVNSPHISQPACTAVQIGLVNLFKSWGIEPSSVVGHSSGEIAAAYAAGAFDADAAMALSYHRGCMTSKLKELFPDLRGGMIAVGMTPADVQPIMKTLKHGYTTIACVNSPSSVTVSGDAAAVQELHEVLDAQGVFNRKLKIDVAYHSEHMARISDLYLASIADRSPAPTLSAKMFSSVYGRELTPSELKPSYWIDNLVSTVQFPTAVSAMCTSESKPDMLVEIGPHSTLKGPIKDTLKTVGSAASKITYAPTLLRGSDDAESVLESAGALFTRGAILDMTAVNFPSTKARFCSLLTDLPRYPWQHSTSYWHESRIPQKHKSRQGKRNDVLGVLAAYSNDLEPTWRNIIRLDDVPWLRHHNMQGMPVFPLAGYLAMAIEAAQQRGLARGVSFDGYELREVFVSSALVLNDGTDTEATITLRPHSDASRGRSDVWDEFNISSWDAKRGWADHCRGLVRVTDSSKTQNNSVSAARSAEAATLALSRSRLEAETGATKPVDEKAMYEILEEVGAGYGSTFQGLRNCFAGPEHSRAEIVVQDTSSIMPKGHEPELVIHPSFLDIFVHLTWPILGAATRDFETLYMPTNIKSVKVHRNVARAAGETLNAWCAGKPDLSNSRSTAFTLIATRAGDATPMIQLEDFVMTPIRDTDVTQAQMRKLCYKLTTQPFQVERPKEQETVATEVIEPVKAAKEVPNGTNGQTDPIKETNGSNGHAELKETNGSNGHDAPVNGSNGTNGTNGHAEPTKVLNGVNGTNGVNGSHVEHENGASETNGANGSSNTNGNGREHVAAEHVEQVEASNGTVTPQVETDIMIVEFGDSNKLARELSGTLDIRSSIAPPIVPLQDLDVTGKRVVLLQCGIKSMRNVTTEEWENLKKILLNAAQVMWVYPKDVAESAMSVGMARTVRSENMSKISTLGVAFSGPTRPSEAITSALTTLWLTEHAEPIKDMEFTFENEQLYVQRVEEDETLNGFVSNETEGATLEMQPYEQPGRRLKFQIGTYGALDTIHYTDDVPTPLGDNEIEIETKATGINFKDIVVAMGQVSQPYIGVECSGVVSSVGKDVTRVKVGDRVMAMTEGAYSTYSRCLETSAFPMPDAMSYEDGATIPVVFCTAYYGLFDLGRLERGERILIHAAAGGVGQAAIKLAQMIGADIYVTVGSKDKKQFLMDQYHIPQDRIFYSRDTSFAGDLRRATQGKGVDVVLNSLAGDILRETWECLAPFGRFIEIGKADITRNSRLDMMKFEYNCTFASVDLTKVAAYKPQLMHRLLKDVTDLFSKNLLSAISPVTVYCIAETERAFRSLQSGKAMGKLVVTPQKGAQVLATKPKLGNNILRADATYLLIGGTGGLGRRIAKWMSSKGARNIVLTSRSASVNERVQALIDDLSPSGTKVLVCKSDASDKASLEKLINEDLKDLPPVRGVLHGAMVLKDMLFEQMSLADFHGVTTCKVEGALNLHDVLASSPLDFFVAFSSIAGVVGNRGQAAYSAANVFLDEFMRFRRARNLPGVSIDLAAVSNVGYLADGSEARRQEVLKNIGGDTIDESEVLALFAAAVTGKIDASAQGQCITGLDAAGEDSFWLSDGKFAILQEKVLAETKGAGGSGQNIALSKIIRNAESKQVAAAALYEQLAAKISAILVIPLDAIDPSITLKSLGLDSLVAIEIRNWIARETEVNVQVLELLSSGSISSLVDLILKKMGL